MRHQLSDTHNTVKNVFLKIVFPIFSVLIIIFRVRRKTFPQFFAFLKNAKNGSVAVGQSVYGTSHFNLPFFGKINRVHRI